MKDTTPTRLGVVILAVTMALMFELVIVWRGFDLIGTITTCFLVAPLMILFISIQQRTTHHKK